MANEVEGTQPDTWSQLDIKQAYLFPQLAKRRDLMGFSLFNSTAWWYPDWNFTSPILAVSVQEQHTTMLVKN
jgi:hypothetical protein